MISQDELKKIISDKVVIKEFNQTGQKKVLLVKNPLGQQFILKICKFGDVRVIREIEIITENNIPGVPKVSKINEHTCSNGDKYHYYYEEYIPGGTLEDRLKKSKLTILEGVKLLEFLLEIVVHLEELKIVHRDIKPGNILCGLSGYNIIDFGIARDLAKSSLTMTQAQMGPHTPGYAAPELFQYRKEEIDSRADLFSVGVVAYQSLTGVHPFIDEGDNHIDIWYKTKTITPQEYLIEGDTQKQLISFIQTLMNKHIMRRPPTAKKALEWFKAVKPTLELGGE